MSVSQMKRLYAVVANDDADKLTERLMWLSAVEIEADEADELTALDCSAELAALNAAAADFKNAHDFLSPYAVKSRGLFKPRPEIARSVVSGGFMTSKPFLEAEASVREALALASSLKEAEAEITARSDTLRSLAPWMSCRLPLSGYKTKYTETVLGVFAPGSEIAKITDAVSDAYSAVIEVVSADISGTYVSVTACSGDMDDALRQLSQNGFSRGAFDAYKNMTALVASSEAAKKLEAARERAASVKERAVELALALPDIECFSDAILIALGRVEGKRRLSATERTVLLKGWVPAAVEADVAAELDAIECAYEMLEPSEDEEPPVLLNNRRPADAFEPVVALYSLPKYGTFDPTSIMSVFYVIIFGLMFADVGYGLLLTSGCLAGLRLMKPRGSMKKFMEMFAVCGLSCAVMGVIFGGYFGDMPQAIAQNMFGVTDFPDLSLWFNPMNEPMTFLIVSLGMGVVHLVAALIVKLYIMCKAGRPLEALFDVGSWLLLFSGAGVMLFAKTTGLAMLGAGVLMLILTQGREEKNPVMKLLKGILSLYDIVSYISDLLSYSRILSLGLASAVIASVINILGTMGGFSPAGIIVMLLAFAAGHIINLVINVLGCFVHTSRLQYIEFFGKFYEDGGRPFAPLEPEAKYISLT